MADPISVAAGVIGIVTAAMQVSNLLIDFTRRTKHAPVLANIVLTEVDDIYAIMKQLQPFLLGLEIPDQSRTSLLQVDSVVAVLTSCVATFSELKELTDQLKARDLGFLERSKWVFKESAISGLVSRLQANKLSLSLMLNIVNGTSMQEVRLSVNRLNRTMNDNYQEIMRRLRSLESQQISLSQRSSYVSTLSSVSDATIRGGGDAGGNEGRRLSRSFFQLAFEKDLALSRVYKRILSRLSISSIFSTEDPKTSWSMVSGLSVADVASRISVLNLAITTSEVYNAEQYTNTERSTNTEQDSDIYLNDSGSFSPHDRQVEVKSTIRLNFNREDHMRCVKLSIVIDYFLRHNFVLSEFTSERMITTALEDLGILTYPRLDNPFRLYALYNSTSIASKSQRMWQIFAMDDMPLPHFFRWLREGRVPIFMIRAYGFPFDGTSGVTDKPIEELGYSVDSWPLGVIDKQMFSLHLENGSSFNIKPSIFTSSLPTLYQIKS